MNFFGIGLPELAVIAAIGLLVFGPKRLPELGRTLGKTLKGFQSASSEFEREFRTVISSTEASPADTSSTDTAGTEMAATGLPATQTPSRDASASEIRSADAGLSQNPVAAESAVAESVPGEKPQA